MYDNLTDWDIYTNRINQYGEVVWAESLSKGICVIGGADDQKMPKITTDGEGGAIIVWRHGMPGYYDIYARRFIADGTLSTDLIWWAGGCPVCIDTLSQLYPQIISTGTGEAIIVWQDGRNISNNDIYAQLIPRTGWVDAIMPDLLLTLYQNHPNPFNPFTIIQYNIRRSCPVTLEIFNVSGKRIDCLVNEFKEKGFYTASWDGRDLKGNKVSSGIYFYRLTAEKERVSKKMILLK